MPGLPDDLVAALDVACATDRLLIACDFDGTLAPIVDDPADARALPAAATALSTLAERGRTSVVLVSGRALATLRELAERSGIPDAVHAVGSHGAEFDTGGLERSDWGNVAGFGHDIDQDLLARVVEELRGIAARRPGVTVEPKPASVALHVRNASPLDGDAALREARAAARDWDVEATAGKAVLEFAVITTDKGEAVDVVRAQHDATAVVFLGDDVTDEKAFRRMRDGDVGVKVGSGATLAGYRVDSPEDVAAVLEYVVAHRV